MSVLIKDMEMPNKCEECPLFDGDLGGCGVTNYFILRKWGKGKPDWCPLVEVPDVEAVAKENPLVLRDTSSDPYSADQTWAEYTLKQTSEVEE